MQSGCVKTIDSCWVLYEESQSSSASRPRTGSEATATTDDAAEASAQQAPEPARPLVGSGLTPLSVRKQAPAPLPALPPAPMTGKAPATAPAPMRSSLQPAVEASSRLQAPLRSATAPALLQQLPPTVPTALNARGGNETTPSQKVVSAATLQCAPYPPEEGSQGSAEKRCIHGNGLGDGHVYFWNADRGTPRAACGEHADCSCCRKRVSEVARARSWEKAREGAGCSNWQSIHAFEPVVLGSVDKCGEYCRAHQGCVGFDYQKEVDSMCSQNSGAGRGACLLWFGDCQDNSNACYDRYEMIASGSAEAASSSGTTLSALRSLGDQWERSEKKGCANWQSIQQDSVTASDSNQCAALCELRGGCKGFGFKTANGCDPQGNGAHRGACVLYSGECKFARNDCWDHYGRRDVAPAALQAPGLPSSAPTSPTPSVPSAPPRGDGTATTAGTTGAPSEGPGTGLSQKPPPVAAPAGGAGQGGEDTATAAGDLSAFARDDVAEIEDVAAPASAASSGEEVAGALRLEASHPEEFSSEGGQS
ncbi:unnamed protein product, partial [Prorocentrum cordatum]